MVYPVVNKPLDSLGVMLLLPETAKRRSREGYFNLVAVTS